MLIFVLRLCNVLIPFVPEGPNELAKEKNKSMTHRMCGVIVQAKGHLPCKIHFALTTIFIFGQPVSKEPQKLERSILFTILYRM